MKMKQKVRWTSKFISALLSLLMVFALVPAQAFASVSTTLSTPSGSHEGQVHVVVENNTYSTAHGAPWDGTLANTWVDIDNNSTMMSAVVAALGTVNAKVVGADSNYISSINGLAQFDGGTASGWMGSLNDWFTNTGFAAITVASGELEAGDEIDIMYTSNGYGADLGSSWDNNDTSLKALQFNVGTLSPSFISGATSGTTNNYTLTVPSGTTGVTVTPTAANKNFQVRTSVGSTTYKRSENIPVSDGTVITVGDGDPSWPTMNAGAIVKTTYAVTVQVAAAAPTITVQPQGATYTVGDASTSLSVAASTTDSGTLSYQWYSNTSDSTTGGTAMAGATSATYTPGTTDAGMTYYYVIVTNTNGTEMASTTSATTAIQVNTHIAAATPTITVQPQGATYTVGDASTSLSVAASTTDSGTLSYQWYSNTSDSTTGGTAIAGATSATYTPGTTDAGMTYYYVIVTNTNGTETASTTSTTTAIQVNTPAALIITTDLSTTPVTCFQNAYLTRLSVTAKANDGGTLSYQWYSGTDAGHVTTAISGETTHRYRPNTQTAGTTYYQVIVTDTLNGQTSTATSSVASVTVNPMTLNVSITASDGTSVPADGYQYNVGDTATTLLATGTASASGADISKGTWTYTWFTVSSSGSIDSAPGTNDQATYTPSTTKDGIVHYVCYADFELNDVSYNSIGSSPISVKVCAASAQAPSFSTQPSSKTYLLGTTYTVMPLNVYASTNDGGTLSYQWYVSTDNDTFTSIDGATSPSYAPSSPDTATTSYYKCVATNTLNSVSGHTYISTTTSTIATLAFATVADVGGTWTGSGTADSPYLIATQSDLSLLQNLVNTQGFSFQGIYFKMTNDITLPSGWVPIGGLVAGQRGEGNGINILPFSGTFDGGGYTLTVPDGGLPLFGYVRFATVKNLNIYGTNIVGYGLVNNYCVDYGSTGDYSDWTATATYPNMPTTVTIDNVTLKSGSSTQQSGFIGGYASGADTVYIRNSTIESNVVIGSSKDQSSIGSFAGAFNGYIENCVSYATVYGVNSVGGLVGSKGQSMGNCTVQSSAFNGSVIASGKYAGGIFGSGYSSPSAPNTPCISVQNCYVTGSITGSDYVGGILGAEPAVKQNWANGIGCIQNNHFSGTVTAITTGTANVGGIIGYMNSLDRYNIISNNYYLDTCGASRGIGAVGAVDTTTAVYSRTDDPTGADAEKLTKSATAAQFADGTVTAALNSGNNSSDNWVQNGSIPAFGSAVHLSSLVLSGYKSAYHGGAFDPSTLKAYVIYSDGTNKAIDMSQVTLTGLNSDVKGAYTVTATYDNHTFVFATQIVDNADYTDDVAAAKTAVSAATYAFPASAANTSDGIKSLVQSKIDALGLGGVTATVTMDSFTPAVIRTSSGTGGTAGSFTFTVNLSKGQGAANTSDSVSLTGAITNTAPALSAGVEASTTASVDLGNAYTLDLSSIFSDADGDALTYSVGIDGGDGTAADASYSYTPSTAGTHTLVFTANDGTADSTSTYTVTLTAKQTYAKLTSLLVHTDFSPSASNVLLQNAGDSYGTSPTFDPATTSYTLAMQADTTTQLRFRPVASEAGATVTLYYGDTSKDITWTSGSSTWANCLMPGKNTLTMVVTPPAGSAERSTAYTLNVDCLPTLKALSASTDSAQLYLDKTFAAATTGYSLTVPASAKTVTLAATPNSADYGITYNGGTSNVVDVSSTDKIDVAVTTGSGSDAVTNTYSFNLNKVAQLGFSVNATPAGAIVKVYDQNGKSVTANSDGTFSGLFSTYTYTYTVTKHGYVAQSGTVPAAGGSIDVVLTAAPADSVTDVSTFWPNFRGNDSNMAITDVELPMDAANVNLKWNQKLGTGWNVAPSVQIIVDGTLVVMCGTTIYKLDLQTGDTLQTGTMVATPNWGYTPPTYADGMIFVPLDGGRVQAFNAKTLESLWVYTDSLGGQALSPITYSNGYIYTGFWNGETKSADYVCLSTTDEDTTSFDEAKTATWRFMQAGGFYWAGSVVVGDAVIVGTDDGASGSTGSSKLYSFDKTTGTIISSLDLTGDQRSSIAYDSDSDKIYFTTKAGYLYSASVDTGTGKISGLKGVDYNAQCTSTPVVYKGKVYFGTGSGISSSGSSGSFVAADADTLEMLYSVDMKGYPQCSMLMTTAYEASTGHIYFYSTYNATPGGISMIKVDPNDTTGANASLTELYDAAGFSQYCISSPVCGQDGTIYYKNDSGNILAVGWTTAGNVVRLIDKIGTVTLASDDGIIAARSAYNALSADDQADVTNYGTLLLAESTLSTLQVSNVKNLIDAIGAVTTGSASAISLARNAYEALPDALKTQIGNVQTLLDAETAYISLTSGSNSSPGTDTTAMAGNTTSAPAGATATAGNTTSAPAVSNTTNTPGSIGTSADSSSATIAADDGDEPINTGSSSLNISSQLASLWWLWVALGSAAFLTLLILLIVRSRKSSGETK